MFVIPIMTRLGITNWWGVWSTSRETVTNSGILSYEGMVGAHIVFSGLCCLASTPLFFHYPYALHKSPGLHPPLGAPVIESFNLLCFAASIQNSILAPQDGFFTFSRLHWFPFTSIMPCGDGYLKM